MSTYTSKYKGSTAAWLSFLCAWLDKRGDSYELDKGFDFDECVSQFPSEYPASYVHFFAAMEALAWPGLIRVEAEAEDSVVDFLPLREVAQYFLACDDIRNSMGIYFDIDEVYKSPGEFSDKDYRTYSKLQEELVPYVPPERYHASLLVGSCEYDLFMSRVLLNPLVKFDDGEWEAVLMNFGCHFYVRLPSFAELVVWFYLRDPVSGVQLDDLYGDHRDDASGISKCLFE